MNKFKFLEHTADVKFQAFGKSLEEAFKNSALVLKETICKGIKVKEKTTKNINIKGKDLESLLYSFLEEILFLLEGENFLISKVKNLEISKDISDKKNLINKKTKLRAKKSIRSEKYKQLKLKAIVAGDKSSNYTFTNAVKAITYNDMFVRKEKDKWICQVVLDV